MANLLRAEFTNSHDGRTRRGYLSHLSDGSTNKPLCGCKNRIAVGDIVAARWLVVQGEAPTCPVCDRIAKRRMRGAA